MLLDVIFGALFLGSIAPVVLPDETEKVRRIAKESIVLTREQMAASAKSTNHPLIKGYRTQSEARRNRARLDAGETIYFPNGSQIIVEVGLKDTQVDGWWYAWDATDRE